MSEDMITKFKTLPKEDKADVICTWINNVGIECGGCPMKENCRPGHSGFLDLFLEVMA